MRKESKDIAGCIVTICGVIVLIAAVLGVAVKVFRMIAY